MRFVRRYLIPRLLQYFFVIWLGITIIFFIPRLLPTDPVQRVIAEITARSIIDPQAVQETVRVLREMYGLEAGLLAQYGTFWKRLFTGDFGPSLSMFPTPVLTLMGKSLPWTIGLMGTSMVLGWLIGNILGGLAGYFSSRILRVIDAIIMCIRPIPHYIMGLALIIFFAYLLPICPLGGGYTVGMSMSFTWRFAWDVLKHAILPALTLMLLTTAVNHQTMRLLVQGVREEDYVRYAKIGGVSERIIFSKYIMRNALLPQVTALTLSLGQILGGALIVEIVFAYPGIGTLLYRSIISGDYNMLMGITTLSVIAITTGILIIDLLYPLLDPRIRFR